MPFQTKCICTQVLSCMSTLKKTSGPLQKNGVITIKIYTTKLTLHPSDIKEVIEGREV